ncbi:MAG: XrtY-associated glycosyltransferase XYAG1 [Saprospiraceae bacterium]
MRKLIPIFTTIATSILHITPYYKPAYQYGGPIISVSSLCESHAKNGHQVTVFTTNANVADTLSVPLQKKVKVDGVPVMYFSRWTGDSTFFSPSLLKELWRSADQYEYIHIHTWWNLVALFSVLVCWLKGIRPILSTRGMIGVYSFQSRSSTLKKVLHWTIGKWLLKQTIFHATVPKEAEENLHIHADWTHFILPNIVEFPAPQLPQKFTNPQKISKPSAINKQPLQLLFLSRIHEIKGLELLLEALAKVAFDWELKIAGDGDKAYIERLKIQAKQLDIATQISWIGWAAGAEKQALFQQNDLLVLVSKSENFANCVLEALVEGLPVLVSEQVGLSYYVAEKDLGWVCQRKLSSVVTTLEEIYHATQKRQAITKKAVTMVRKDFAGLPLAEKYVKQYERATRSVLHAV